MQSRFVEILGNSVEIFHYMLEGFFKDWPGAYEVLTTDTDEYLFQPETASGAQSFCRNLRHTTKGHDLCLRCHQRHAALAAQAEKPTSLEFICDSGLFEIAVPIIIDGEAVATIFCGQGRSTDSAQEELGRQTARKAERELGLPDGTLLEAREQTPLIERQKIETVTEQLWQMATYASNLAKERIELNYQIGETRQIRKALQELSGAIESLDEFWRRMTVVLRELCEVIGAAAGLLLMYERKAGSDVLHPKVRVVAGIPNSFVGKTYIENNREFLKVLEQMEPEALDFGMVSRTGTVCRDIAQLPDIKHHIDKVALVPLRLDPMYGGVIVFFLSRERDAAESLPIHKELDLFLPVTDRIATAYLNCRLYTLRGEWLKNVSHQLIAPLTGIQGHVENLGRWLNFWLDEAHVQIGEREDNTEDSDNHVNLATTIRQLRIAARTLDAALWMTTWVSRLARNFAWVTEVEEEKRPLVFELIQEVPSLLIRYARNVQGLARSRRLYRVHVDTESVKQLNGRLRISRILFAQAIGNLLDNAVKYSDWGTEVLITASLADKWGIIHITNRGIPILPEEVGKVFEREYRSDAARARYTVGTGIGLPIARDMIERHGGQLTVQPSRKIQEPSYSGYETTFNVLLPLH